MVLIIYALKPPAPVIPEFSPKEKIIAVYTGIAARLMLLYIVCAISISVLGGIIDTVSQMFQEKDKLLYGADNIFKLDLIANNLPMLAVNILSRIPINIVDRFIVIFGGYLISWGIISRFYKVTNEF